MRKLIELTKNIAFISINAYRKFIYLFCCLFHMSNNKVFINCFDGKGFSDNPKYIILQLLKINKEVKIYWICNNKRNNENNQIKYIKPFSIKAIYHQATSKVWISTVRMPYYSLKRKGQIYFQTWHGGLAFKKIENECPQALSSRYINTAKNDSKMIDYYVSSNKDNSKLFLNYFWFSGGEILECGSPRNDLFFNSTQNDISKIRKKYSLGDKKIVVYAPTFRKDNSFNAYNIDYYKILDTLQIKDKEEWIFIIRLHPRLEKISEKYIDFNEKLINGSVIEDIQELLLVTDMLITDYSSIAFDFMLTNKPILLYASDIEDYKKDRDFHINLEDTPFMISTNNDEIIKNIQNLDVEKYEDDVSLFKKKYGFFDNNNSSAYIANIINNNLI